MKPLTGCLRNPIDPTAAPARGLARSLGLPPDANDVRSYARSELKVRFAALDEFFGLDFNAQDIWQQRAKALVARKYNIDPSASDWWVELTLCLAQKHVPGLSFKRADKKNHGAPRQWTDEKLAQLFADIEFLKRTTKLSVKNICDRLPHSKNYVKRWGCYRPPGLRKQYLKAKYLSRGLLFQFVLCGLSAISTNNIEGAAIEQHALKCPLK